MSIQEIASKHNVKSLAYIFEPDTPDQYDAFTEDLIDNGFRFYHHGETYEAYGSGSDVIEVYFPAGY